MSEHRPQPSPGQFYQVLEDGRFAFYFDSHTLSSFSQCEQLFFLKNVMFAPQQLKLKGPQRACTSIGSWWSLVSELFYKKIAERQKSGGEGFVDLMEMFAIAGKAWIDYGMDEMSSSGSPKMMEQYEKFAIPIRAGEFNKHLPGAGTLLEQLYSDRAKELRHKAYVMRCCDDQQYKEAEKLEEAARKIESQTALPLGPLIMAGQYYQTYAERDIRDWRIIAAEAPFGRHGEVIVGETDKVVVYWQGKPDLVIWEEKTGVLAPLDQKTKDHIPWNVENIWKPHNQMSGYVFSLDQIASDLGFANINVDRCIISVCARLQPATPKTKGALPKSRFVRVRPTFSRDEIQEWCRGILHKAERLRFCVENSSISGDVYIRNEQACHLYAGCEYRGICSRPPGVRPILIQSDYLVSDPWSPFDDED